jgi:hypothetical protein
MLSLCNLYTLTVMDKVSGDTFELTTPLLVDDSFPINFGYLHNVQHRLEICLICLLTVLANRESFKRH